MDWNPAVGIPLIVVGAIVLVLIYLFGQPKKPEQGERKPAPPTIPDVSPSGRRSHAEGK